MVNLQSFFSLHDVMKLTLKVKKHNKAKGVISARYGVRSKITKGLVLKHLPQNTPKTTPKSQTKSEGKQP